MVYYQQMVVLLVAGRCTQRHESTNPRDTRTDTSFLALLKKLRPFSSCLSVLSLLMATLAPRNAILKRVVQAVAASLLRRVGDDQESFGDPDGLRFAPALTRLLHGQQIST